MAIIRNSEIRDLSDLEQKEKIKELKDEIFKERSKIAAGGSADNPGRIKEIRRTIARILTIQGEQKRAKK